MLNKLAKAKQILKKYNQEHLLNFYDEIDDTQKEMLLNQILSIDFEEILSLYDNSMKPQELVDVISPINHLEIDNFSNDEISYFTKIGEKLICDSSVCVVTMAGGQGSRLGHKGPKGTYMLDTSPIKKSLFEILCDSLKSTNQKYNIQIPWYIMTSLENDFETQKFFEKNNYFGYPKSKIKFFTQSFLPLIDINRNLILKEPYQINQASNGNGNIFSSLAKHKILDELSDLGIKWIFFGGIDNVLLKMVDPFFLGITADKNFQISSKTIFKKEPLEKTAIYCKRNGKPAILDYVDITLELSETKDENGMYLFRESNMLSHLMSLDAVKKASTLTLPYHRAFKKNPFINFEGVKQVPEKPNVFKFENFIFDAFSHFDDILLLRVNESKEFAPIKDFTGIYTPETALEKYNSYWNLK